MPVLGDGKFVEVKMRRSVGVMAVLVLALVLVPVVSAGHQASLAWNRYDVDVLVNRTFNGAQELSRSFVNAAVTAGLVINVF